MATFRVMQSHRGDQQYRPGDMREADPAMVAHLVASGVLEEVKMEPPVEKKGRAKK